MKKLKCFSLVDLSVVVGLVFVLSGASLIMFGKVAKNNRDDVRLEAANQIFSQMQNYYQSNFHAYPIENGTASTRSFQSVQIGKENDIFLQIALGETVTKLKAETLPGYGYVYLYSTDGQQAAIVVRRLEGGSQKCNTSADNIPEIVKDYLTRDSSACYFKASS